MVVVRRASFVRGGSQARLDLDVTLTPTLTLILTLTLTLFGGLAQARLDLDVFQKLERGGHVFTVEQQQHKERLSLLAKTPTLGERYYNLMTTSSHYHASSTAAAVAGPSPMGEGASPLAFFGVSPTARDAAARLAFFGTSLTARDAAEAAPAFSGGAYGALAAHDDDDGEGGGGGGGSIQRGASLPRTPQSSGSPRKASALEHPPASMSSQLAEIFGGQL